MYGIVVCASCKRKRIVDLGCETSVCPYCDRTNRLCDLAVLFSDGSQSVVREAFNNADSSKYPEPRKKSGIDHDPVSTLIYRYEHASGTFEKLTVLAEGLTDINGNFTLADVEELFPGEGEHLLKQMMSADIVIEIHHGTFKAI
ncbi:MAG: hypothetical protein LBE47_02365 [Methanomassiliicoccaceae archaeon]|jgi:hypothetical protein|nr:hypothetical protein [Methanomassiliicoccaceae archaeon]